MSEVSTVLDQCKSADERMSYRCVLTSRGPRQLTLEMEQKRMDGKSNERRRADRTCMITGRNAEYSTAWHRCWSGCRRFQLLDWRCSSEWSDRKTARLKGVIVADSDSANRRSESSPENATKSNERLSIDLLIDRVDDENVRNRLGQRASDGIPQRLLANLDRFGNSEV